MNEKETIEQELLSISPVIAGLSKQTPYVAPDGYMEQAKFEILKPLCLREIGVPENYFEQLPSIIKQRIKAENTTPKANSKHVVVQMTRVIGWTAAASILLIAGLFSILNGKTKDEIDQPVAIVETESSRSWDNEMDQLDEIEIIQYLQENGYDVEAAMVASYSESTPAESEIDLLLSDNLLQKLEL